MSKNKKRIENRQSSLQQDPHASPYTREFYNYVTMAVFKVNGVHNSSELECVDTTHMDFANNIRCTTVPTRSSFPINLATFLATKRNIRPVDMDVFEGSLKPLPVHTSTRPDIGYVSVFRNGELLATAMGHLQIFDTPVLSAIDITLLFTQPIKAKPTEEPNYHLVKSYITQLVQVYEECAKLMNIARLKMLLDDKDLQHYFESCGLKVTTPDRTGLEMFKEIVA